jgi:alpha-ketoglutarate-dependent taurine dioxygenase
MTKLEEVARAIYAKRNGPGAKPWSLLTKAHRTPYLDDARAAIEALRQPTRDMYHAAVTTHTYENGGIEHSPGLSWKAMIDAILSEGE